MVKIFAAAMIGALLYALLCSGAASASDTLSKRQKLALLVTAPFQGNDFAAMPEDLRVMKNTLLSKGFSENEIQELTLTSKERRTQLINFVDEARKRIATWKNGSVFFYYTGHGCFEQAEKPRRPGLQLASDEYIYWDQLFQILDVPQGVDLVLLPDC